MKSVSLMLLLRLMCRRVGPLKQLLLVLLDQLCHQVSNSNCITVGGPGHGDPGVSLLLPSLCQSPSLTLVIPVRLRSTLHWRKSLRVLLGGGCSQCMAAAGSHKWQPFPQWAYSAHVRIDSCSQCFCRTGVSILLN